MSRVVWIKDEITVWTKAEWLGNGQVKRLHDGRLMTVAEQETLSCDQAIEADGERMSPDHEEDMTNLRNIHQASMLDNLYKRFKEKHCCTFISNVLLSVNPMEAIEEPTELVGTKKVAGVPHAFSTAEVCFQQLERDQKSQCIIISGESGAGKSETCKRVIRHLVVRSGETCNVDEQLLAASPILESFGNAQTCSNGNSSRFGKFVSLFFAPPASDDGRQAFQYASIQTYLLERSRITRHDPNERSFHIFYQLLAGVQDDEHRQLLALDVDHVKQSELNAKVSSKSDKQHYEKLVQSLSAFGMGPNDTFEIFKIVAAVIHLLSIEFEEKDTMEGKAAFPAPQSQPCLLACATLLGTSQEALTKVLTERSISLRGETMTTQRNAEAATQARDAIAKSLYQSLFSWLVSQINAGLGNGQFNEGKIVVENAMNVGEVDSDQQPFIGILDIFGFECFEKNSFEQLLINFANEALQTTFNNHLFQSEQELYASEGLDLSGLDQPPNSACRDCFELLKKPTKLGRESGLLTAIDAISVGPEPSDKKLITHLHRAFQNHPCYLQPHPRVADSTFIVQHYAGAVSYHIHGFVEKNTDRLPQEARSFFADSSVPLVCQVMASRNTGASPGLGAKSKSIAARFEQQMQQLLAVLNSTRCSFIRCIKPNAKLCSTIGFDHKYVAEQLNCLSIPQTAQLLRAGLPGRIPYSRLYDTFAEVIPQFLFNLPKSMNKTVVRELLFALEVDPDTFKLGHTRAFFKNGALAAVDEKLRLIKQGEFEIPASLAQDLEVACAHYAARKMLLYAGAVARIKHRAETRRKRINQAAETVVSVMRCVRDRIRFLKQRQAAKKLVRWWKQQCASNAAVTVIQSFVRMALERLRFRRFRSGVIALQRTWIYKSVLFTYSSSEDETSFDEATFEHEMPKMDKEELQMCVELELPLQQQHKQEEEEQKHSESEATNTSKLSTSSGIEEDEQEDEEDAPFRHATLVIDQDDDEEEENEEAEDLEDGYCADDDIHHASKAPRIAIHISDLDENQQNDDGDEEEDDRDSNLDRSFESLEETKLGRDSPLSKLMGGKKKYPGLRHNPGTGTHSSEELTSILLKLSHGSGNTIEDEGALQAEAARRANWNKQHQEQQQQRYRLQQQSQRGFFNTGVDQAETKGMKRKSKSKMPVDNLPPGANVSRIIEEYNHTLSDSGSGKGDSWMFSSDAKENDAGHNKKKFKFPALFKLPNREQRAVARKLKSAIRKKHYRQLIEALIRARDLGIKSPDVGTAEAMVYRIKSIHAQQLLREAMVLRDIDALEEAIQNAVRFGMEDSQGLLKQAHEMCTSMKDQRRHSLERHLSGKKLARKKSPKSNANIAA